MSENRIQAAEDHYYSALDHVSEGRHEEAITEYIKAIEANPEFADAMHGLTRAYQDAARYDEAIAIAQRLIAIDPDDILAHTSLSMLFQRKGMIPEAEEEGNKARILGWKKQLAEQKKS